MYVPRVLRPFAMGPALLVGCTLAYGSGASDASYAATSREERVEYDKADRGVAPEQVRLDMAAYAHTTIAWAGVVREVSIASPGVVILVEYHKFYWMAEQTREIVRYALSATSEGTFRVTVAHESEADAEPWVREGDMVLVYGKPRSVDEDGVVVVDVSFLKVVRLGGFEVAGEGE